VCPADGRSGAAPSRGLGAPGRWVPAGRGWRLATLGAAGAAAVAVASRVGGSWCTPGLAVWAAGLGLLAGCDGEGRVLPKRLVYSTLAATVAGLVVAASRGGGWNRLTMAVVVGAAAEATFAAVALAWPSAYGFGDVRLVGLVGVGVGWVAPILVVVAVAGGLVAFVVVWLAGWATGRMSRRTPLPLGTFLAAGGVVTVAVVR
jgi:leader peptidase (prepilin peptidase) / N-methyltransferase